MESKPATGASRNTRQQIREIVEQQLVDILLMSVSNSDALAVDERLFDDSPITPAIRANDTTDIWLVGSQASYARQPSLPFRTAVLDEAMEADGGRPFTLPGPRVDLGLYSITLNNDATLDRATLEAYRDFRLEARQLDFRHFLEVFAPNAPGDNRIEDVPRFVNDSIVRLLAGIGRNSRPLFLKIPYFGPARAGAARCLRQFTRGRYPGRLGGKHLRCVSTALGSEETRRRAALFGRKINNAEHQLSFIKHLRALADGQIEPAEAVRSYHSELAKLKIAPHRALADDLKPSLPSSLA